MATVVELAESIVSHVNRHGLDDDYYLKLEWLKDEVGGSDPNGILQPLQQAGMPEALRARAERIELGGGDAREVQRLRSRAATFELEPSLT